MAFHLSILSNFGIIAISSYFAFAFAALVQVKIPTLLGCLGNVMVYSFTFLDLKRLYLSWRMNIFRLVSSVGSVGRISLIAPFLIMMCSAWLINAECFSFHLQGRSFK